MKKSILISLLLLSMGLLFNSNVLDRNLIYKISDSTSSNDCILKLPKNQLTFNDMPIAKVNNVEISLLNELLECNIYEKAQRYYIPLETICNSLNIIYVFDIPYIIIDSNILIDSTSNTAIIGDLTYTLRGNIITIESKPYISISDLEYLFNLRSHFNFSSKRINLVNNPTKFLKNIPNSHSKKVALIRLEDISSGGYLHDSVNIEKTKILGDILFSNNICFHVSWIPRYKEPSKNIDNNLLSNSCIENIAFINLLDYLINSGGIIGLHGYSHQFLNEDSLVGIELSKYANSSFQDTISVIENSINTSTALNIPIFYFESPHYKSSFSQKLIIEEYFKYIYEPFNLLNYHLIHYTKSNNIYIPTPLNYITTSNISNILSIINNPKSNIFVSFFYHPILELDFINFTFTDTSFYYNHSKDSPINKIISALNINNYITSYITSF